MLRVEYITDVEERASRLRKAGFSVSTNHHLPSVSVEKNGSHLLFCQGDDAQQFLDDVPDDIKEETFLLVYFDSAGVLI